MPPIIKSILKRVLPVLLIGGIAFAIYSETFHAPFQYDDKEFIINNTRIKDITKIYRLHEIHGSRIVAFVTFALNYHFGELNTFGYHVVNFSILIMTGLLIWRFSRQLFLLYTKKPLTTNLEIAAALAALFFVSHPVQTQAITYITQRFASLAAMFYLASICAYIKGRLCLNSSFLRTSFLLLTSLFGLMAFFTKEISVTLPLMIAFIEFQLIQPYISEIKLRSKKKQNKKIEVDDNLSLFAKYKKPLLLLIPILLFFITIVYPGAIRALYAPRISESHTGDVFNFWTYGMTQFRVMAHFFRLLVIPFHQNVNYDFPMSHSPFEWNTFGSFVLYVAILIGAIKLRKKSPLLSFLLLWFFIVLAANFVPRAHVIFEHKLYLASIGPCIALSYYFFKTFKSAGKLIVCSAIIILTFSYLTFQRNKVWLDEVTMWKDIVKKSPNKAISWGNLGSLYTVRRQYDLALEALNKSIDLDEDYLAAYNNRGFISLQRGKLDDALRDFNRAIAIDPAISVPHTNKAKVLKQKGQINEALAILTKAIGLNKNDYEAFNLRGSIYGNLKRYELALADFEQCTRINPHYSHPHNNISLIKKFQNKLDEALIHADKAISLEPYNSGFYINRAVIHMKQNNAPLALRDCNIAIKIKPNSMRAYNQRGTLYGQLKRYDLAIADFKKAVSLSPKYAAAYNNLGKAYALANQPEEGIKYLNKAIELNSNLASAYFDRGTIYKKLNQNEKAAADFKKFKQITGK